MPPLGRSGGWLPTDCPGGLAHICQGSSGLRSRSFPSRLPRSGYIMGTGGRGRRHPAGRVLEQIGSTKACAWVELSTRESAAQGPCGQFSSSGGPQAVLESCLGVPCGAGSLLGDVDECCALAGLDCHVPSLVALVQPFHRRGQDPGLSLIHISEPTRL